MDEPQRPHLRVVASQKDASVDDASQSQSQPQIAETETAALIPQVPVVPAALPFEAHFKDLLWSAGTGALIGTLTKQAWTGAAIGALAGVAIAAVEKAVFGERVLVNRKTQMSMIAVGLGATVGAGYLSWKWR